MRHKRDIFLATMLIGTCFATAEPPASTVIGTSPVWDDGLSEMSYFRATDSLYGKMRAYTRVHMVNRQWMDDRSGIKTNASAADALPVIKMNISEEIPTENYNYRFLTTVFLHRESLTPFKAMSTSQEWCGATYKQLRWSDDRLDVASFSYKDNQGDKQFSLPSETVVFESLFLLAREVAASKRPQRFQLIAPIRSNNEIDRETHEATLSLGDELNVRMGKNRVKARRVDLNWQGPPTSFIVETAAPYRLLRYRSGPMRGELINYERRAYWDRSWGSNAYEQGRAP